MTEKIPSSISHKDIIHLISHAEDDPLDFLREQREYLNLPPSKTNSPQLSPKIDTASYTRNKKFPRILNIALGQNTTITNAETYISVVIEHPQALKDLLFEAGMFVVIRLEHVLQLLSPEEISELLFECKRMLDQHGELHLRVPDAKRELNDILRGKNSDTMTFFNLPLLKYFLNQAGFADIESTPSLIAFKEKYDTAGADVTDHIVCASQKKVPHTIDSPLGSRTFIQKCHKFREAHGTVPDVSFIITVYNEASNLPHFLSFLENIRDETGMRREFIFVLNGCTDSSEDLIRNFLDQTSLNAKVVTSLEKGILPAFKEGMSNRGYNGFVGRFDADIFLHPHTLDLMQMHLFENKIAQVTYAEPISMDSPSVYNEPWYNPSILSKRLYYTGKTSLYRENPHLREDICDMPSNLVADDIFTSFYFTYFYGLDSITRTPHALVYEKVVNNFDDLVNQQSRCDSEIKRILEAYPYFNNLNGVTVQEIFPSQYLELISKAKEQSTYVDDWIRLESTK